MATPEDVQKLASLARLSVPADELPTFAKEFDAVIAYVGQLETLSIGETAEILPYQNVLREDGEPTPPGTWTQKITEQFPERSGDSLSVKQIISHD